MNNLGDSTSSMRTLPTTKVGELTHPLIAGLSIMYIPDTTYCFSLWRCEDTSCNMGEMLYSTFLMWSIQEEVIQLRMVTGHRNLCEYLLETVLINFLYPSDILDQSKVFPYMFYMICFDTITGKLCWS